MMYLTYDNYVNRGGNLPESVFTYIEAKAEKKLDYYTHYRIKTFEKPPTEVEDVIFEFINFLEKHSPVDKSIASYSNGIESFSFRENVDPFVELYSIAKEYLDYDLISATLD